VSNSVLPGAVAPGLSRRGWATLLVLSAVVFLDALDVSMVGVALPSIKTHLQMTTSSLQWVVSAYVLGYGGFLLLGGRAADLLGRRRVLLIALASSSSRQPSAASRTTARCSSPRGSSRESARRSPRPRRSRSSRRHLRKARHATKRLPSTPRRLRAGSRSGSWPAVS
jgi:hypothetical protein